MPSQFKKFSPEDYYGSEKHFNSMSHEEKMRLLHWLFAEIDPELGEPFGIYVRPKKKEDKNFEYVINNKVQ